MKQDIDLSSILSPEALAALAGLAVDRGVAVEGQTSSTEDLVGGLTQHFRDTKIGEKEQVFHMKFGDIEFDVAGVKQNLGQTLDSTGLTIWRAAEHLCEHIMKDPSLYKGKHVCELGGGLGVVSILLHKLSTAASVCCTDGDEVSIELLEKNAESTGCVVTASDDGEDKDARSVNVNMGIEKLYWGEHDEFLAKYPHTIDTIIAADVIYEEEQIEPLLTTTSAILKKANPANEPKLILAYCRRNVPIDRVYECATRLGLQHKLLSGDVEPIVEFTLRENKEIETVFR